MSEKNQVNSIRNIA